MKLLTKELIKQIPPTYSQEETEDPICWAKLFTPWSYWTWYVIEFDPEENLCFGYVQGHEAELGYFDLDELEEIKGPLGLKIERDRHFTPTKFSEVKKAQR